MTNMLLQQLEALLTDGGVISNFLAAAEILPSRAML
jgi:hypothetical protein